MSSTEVVKAAETALAALKKVIDEAEELSDDDLNGYKSTYEAHVSLLNDGKEDRIAYEKKAEEERLAAEKKAEEERLAAEKKAEEERLAAEKKVRDDDTRLWIGAIDKYKPLEIQTTSNNASSFSRINDHVINLVVEGGDTPVIKLDKPDGTRLSSTTIESPESGWTANKFVKSVDKSYGAVVSNRGSGPDTSIYINYFYTSPALTTAKTPITGVIPLTGNDAGKLNLTTSAAFPDGHFASRPKAFYRSDGPMDATFLGVKGTLTCTNATSVCGVTDNSGTFSFTQSVIFNPDTSTIPLPDIVLTIPSSLQTEDSKYITFGYWLTETRVGNFNINIIDTFTNSEGYDPTVSVNGGDLLGSATYTGGAAGIYVLKTGDLRYNPDLHNGEFVAGVNLTAQFKDLSGNVSAKDQFKITGTINNFRSITNSEDHDLSNWTLDLESHFGERDALTGVADIEADDPFGHHNATTKGSSTGTGTWTAVYLGNSGADTTTSDGAAAALGLDSGIIGIQPESDDHFEAIVGEFKGDFVDGHVVGSFAAEKD